jgi:Transposase and inactivated derivatives, IS30 family
MTKYNHLNTDERDTIQYMLDKGHTFTSISHAIKKDRTTISKEIKRNRYIKGYDDEFNQKYIMHATEACDILKKKLVCNFCKNKCYCSKRKLYYKSRVADQRYLMKLKDSRSGVNINFEVIEEIEKSIVPLIKDKKQSINQVYLAHKDILYFSIPTLYRYIDLGVLSLTNLDLPKKVKYKPRKNKEEREHKREIALLIGRNIDDYYNYLSKHKNCNKLQMDTVIGTQSNSKALLTLIIVDTNFMFIRLLDKKNIESVNKQIDFFKSKLGLLLYSKIFETVLTDNGSEFYDPLHIEIDYNTGEKIANVFYCKPYSSWQKGTIEKNHEFIRKVFPKGSNFDTFNDDIIFKLESNINNIPRKN